MKQNRNESDDVMSMEGYVYIPQMLYILRLNAEGTDASIEEYELAQFPKLNGWFDEPQRFSHNDEWYKEWDLVGECVGPERIVHYSTRRAELERELGQVKQSLPDFAESVKKVEQCLKSTGLEDIRHESSKANLDFCCFSDTFYVYGRPFLKLIYRLGHRVKTDPIMTMYDLPCWQIEFFHTGGLSVKQGKDLLGEKKSFDEWMRQIITEPEDVLSIKEKIRDQIEKTYGISVQKDDILYDLAAKCYLLKEDTERRLLEDKMPVRDVETDEIAKYTTFEGLVAILQSGKIRMNSIVSMNDKTETDFLEDCIKNYKEEYEQDYDKYLFADKEFITSFTTRIDELDMWRLYGDNARGVCMVFDRNDKKNDGLYKISYIDPMSDLTKEDEIMEALKDKGVRLRLNLLQKFRHFMKHADYDTELEYRLLKHSEKTDGWFVHRDNGVLTPYLEFELRKTGKPGDGDYPFKLKKVIVGPAMREC